MKVAYLLAFVLFSAIMANPGPITDGDELQVRTLLYFTSDS
jgi:hypothetical protein